jgi:hypothetical protein
MTAPMIAVDGFNTYFAERLWEMIPEMYRHEDGLAARPGVLRAMVELMAEQASVLRRSQDRLWDDQFAELCDDWALPYIADLVGARLVAALDQRARRVVVAKTIHYRRRAGTMGLLEQLAIDVTGWDAVVREQFRRLGRTRYLLDPAPSRFAGRVSRTMPGGWADLRLVRAAELAGGPVDEYHYTADVRRHRGTDGRFGIPKLAVHLYRLAVYEMIGVTPFDRGAGRYAFDPAGRDIPLFSPHRRVAGEWQHAREWDLAAPMSCRVLGDAAYEITEALLFAVRAAGLSASATNDLRKLLGMRIGGESRLLRLITAVAQAANVPALTAAAMFARIRDGALVADCGCSALLAPSLPVGAPAAPAALRVVRSPGGPVFRPEIAAASLDGWPALTLPTKVIAVDPALGRLAFLSGVSPTSVSVDYYYGFSGNIGAGPYDRRDADEPLPVTLPPAPPTPPETTPLGGGGLTAALLPLDTRARILDSASYTPIADRVGVEKMKVVAAHGQRPYLRLGASWILDAGTKTDSTLLLDGLWIGSRVAGRAVVLRGDYETVVVDRCTIDPGNLRLNGTTELPAVELLIEGHIERLIIKRSIVGPIRAQSANGVVESLEICDSIVQSIDPAVPAVMVGAFASAISAGDITICNSTVFGDVAVNRLSASGSIVTGVVTVVDAQRGCFRFSAAMITSTLPRRYESYLFESDPTFAFTSTRFGQPAYGQLSAGAPAPLRRGAEDGAEMGAFAFLGNPRKLEGLAAKLEEFMPFGLVPIYIPHT